MAVGINNDCDVNEVSSVSAPIVQGEILHEESNVSTIQMWAGAGADGMWGEETSLKVGEKIREMKTEFGMDNNADITDEFLVAMQDSGVSEGTIAAFQDMKDNGSLAQSFQKDLSAPAADVGECGIGDMSVEAGVAPVALPVDPASIVDRIMDVANNVEVRTDEGHLGESTYSGDPEVLQTLIDDIDGLSGADREAVEKAMGAELEGTDLDVNLDTVTEGLRGIKTADVSQNAVADHSTAKLESMELGGSDANYSGDKSLGQEVAQLMDVNPDAVSASMDINTPIPVEQTNIMSLNG